MTTPSKIYRSHLKRDPKEPPTFDIQERDMEILDAVHQNRFLTMSLLILLFPPDATARERKTPATAQPVRHRNLEQRLKKLFRSYHLQRLRPPFGGEYIYALDTKGAKLLLEKQPELPLEIDWRKKNQDITNSYFDHTLMVSRFRSSLTVGLRHHPTLSLHDYERESADLKAEWKRVGKRVYVQPDAFFTLHDKQADGYLAYFLEADRSTMKLARMIDKYERYAQMFQDKQHQGAFNVQDFRVLTVTKSAERAGNIATLTAHEKSPIPRSFRERLYFTTQQSYLEQPQNVLSAIWRRADDVTKIRGFTSRPLPRI